MPSNEDIIIGLAALVLSCVVLLVYFAVERWRGKDDD